uniref:Histone H2A n=1 Tax=Solanum lycopersicum TaxID=4081 RepID=A0A3Q7IUL2_SOLLC
MVGKGKSLCKKISFPQYKNKSSFPSRSYLRFQIVEKYAERVGVGAPIFLAAVLEYDATEVLDLAGNVAREN